jgi:polysaccharide export outer membrane protein
MAAGKTPAELRDELASKLAQYIEEPQVDVKVVAFNSQKFYVTGSVQVPGTYPVTHIPLRLLEAINLAGGFNEQADIYGATLTRADQTIEVPIYDMLFEGDLRANIVMEHGDVLHIAPDETRRVFVMGEVRQPQSVRMTNKPMTLTQIISEVGGINEERADGRGIYVVRQSEVPEVVNVFQLDASQAYSMSLADDFILNARDIVYVSAAPITRWNRIIGNLLPTIRGLDDLDSIQARQ